jgi:perosamine synthetase
MVKYYHSTPTIENDDVQSLLDTLYSKHLEDGEIVEKLERTFSQHFQRKYAIAVTNGFAAIHLSLIGLNIRKGDEVIIPTYSCPALLNPILILNAIPIIVDIADNSFNIDINQIKNKITKRTKAIIIPHMFGFPAKIDDVLHFGIPIIEDCAQSIGGKYKDKMLGQFGNISVFSFYATKMITGGDGGLILTDDKNIYDIITNYRYYGHKKKHKYVAYNYHLTNLPASLILSQFNKLELFIYKRKQLAIQYYKLLSNNNNIYLDFENNEYSSFFRYPVKVNTSNDIHLLLKKMKENGVLCGYGVLEGLHEIYITNENFKNADSYLSSIISLPIYPSLDFSDILFISELFLSIIRN